MSIKLGDLARDKVTGFEGMVVAVTSWITGCDRLTLQPTKLTKDGGIAKDATFDIMRLQKSKKKQPK